MERGILARTGGVSDRRDCDAPVLNGKRLSPRRENGDIEVLRQENLGNPPVHFYHMRSLEPDPVPVRQS